MEKKYLVNRALADTVSIFSNLSSYASFHPLILRVASNPSDRDEKYEIIEKPYARLPIKIRYQVAIMVQAEKIRSSIDGIRGRTSYLDLALSITQYSGDENNHEPDYWRKSIHGKLLGRKMLKAQDRLMSNNR